jgi:hypothetical protein
VRGHLVHTEEMRNEYKFLTKKLVCRIPLSRTGPGCDDAFNGSKGYVSAWRCIHVSQDRA